MKLLLLRTESGPEGTFGFLFLPGGESLRTGELPWRNNEPNLSCVPAGTYTCLWSYSPRFSRRLYELRPTPGRTGIRIHSANFCGASAEGLRTQLHGCVALGERLGRIEGQRALLLSAPAVRRFESFLRGKPFTLEVRDGTPLRRAD